MLINQPPTYLNGWKLPSLSNKFHSKKLVEPPTKISQAWIIMQFLCWHLQHKNCMQRQQQKQAPLYIFTAHANLKTTIKTVHHMDIYTAEQSTAKKSLMNAGARSSRSRLMPPTTPSDGSIRLSGRHGPLRPEDKKLLLFFTLQCTKTGSFWKYPPPTPRHFDIPSKSKMSIQRKILIRSFLAYMQS